MHKTLIAIIGIIVVGAAVWLAASGGGAPAGAPGETATEARMEQVPDFSLEDYEGRTVSLADFAGKPVVINSWAAWCPFCRQELVDFAAVQEELGGSVAIVAIDRAEPLRTAKGYTDELGITDDLVFLLDPADSFYRSIGGFSMPETIFVDADGNIAHHKRGPMDAEEIRQKIADIQ